MAKEKRITLASDIRQIKPLCADFGVCGGCEFQHIAYADELRQKEEYVLGLLADAGAFEYLGIDAGEATGYRNKMEFSFGDSEKGGALALGIRKRKSFYEVVPPACCNIVDADFRAITLTAMEYFRQTGEAFYHKRTHKGTLRHLVVRKARFTGEILVNIVTSSAFKQRLQAFTHALLTIKKLDGKIVGVLHTVNDSAADTVRDDELRVLHGRRYMFEQLLGLRFKISAFAFFQTNSAGAERLYSTVRDFAGTGNECVLDLYCGTGTIAQVLAPSARRVIGIELVEEAVEAARANAVMNALTNCKFKAGDVLKTVDTLGYRPDLIVLDPPREGVHPKAMPKIIGLGAERIVYVSCKPTSLARDLALFAAGGYTTEKVKIHDMFPRTGHVETVALLRRG